MGANELRKNRKKTRVTIVVGIICKDAIVLACDSQTTEGAAKRTDTTKISALECSGGGVLIAEAGDCTLSGKVVESLAVQLKSSVIDDYRKPADMAQDTVAAMKRDLSRLNNWESLPEMTQNYLDENPFSLMLAYYHQTKPYLYVLNSVPGFATMAKGFVAIGCGATVGEFILGRAGVTEMDTGDALTAAIYTVEEVKRVDIYCGGPTKAAVLGPNRVLYSETESKPIIKSAVDTIAASEEFLKEKWKALIGDLTVRINKNYHASSDGK